jgi:hypothetical protein
MSATLTEKTCTVSQSLADGGGGSYVKRMGSMIAAHNCRRFGNELEFIKQ